MSPAVAALLAGAVAATSDEFPLGGPEDARRGRRSYAARARADHAQGAEDRLARAQARRERRAARADASAYAQRNVSTDASERERAYRPGSLKWPR